MERRDVLARLGALSVLSAMTPLYGQDPHQHVHAPVRNNAVIRTASECEMTGEICLSHCIEILAQGDISLALCAKRSAELISVCRALAAIASQDAPSFVTLAAVAEEVCKRCEAECRKFPQHPQCLACADSCVACATECKKVKAA